MNTAQNGDRAHDPRFTPQDRGGRDLRSRRGFPLSRLRPVNGIRSRVLARLLAVFLLAPGAAAAHDRSVSYSTWVVDPRGAEVTLRMDEREFTRLPQAASPSRHLDETIVDALVARRGGKTCERSAPPRRAASAPGRVILHWRVDCPSAGDLEIESRLFETLRTAHLAFVRVDLEGEVGHEVVLHADRSTWVQPAAGEAPRFGQALGQALLLGLEHIAGGIDHLFFVFGLVVVAASLREIAVVVTAFTLAHTTTLALAALGLLRPAAPPVEALIAASIALVAVENLTLSVAATGRHAAAAAMVVLVPALAAAAAGFGRVPLVPLAGTAVFALCYLAFAERRPGNRRVRWLVAFAFGLLHGFGFAGALVDAGFSSGAVTATLLGFNLGVEVGQLLFVLALWPVLAAARGRLGDRYARLVIEPASVLLLAAAVGWYGVRAFG